MHDVRDSSSESTRKKRKFDYEWTFLKGNFEGAQHPDFDDAKWRRLDLPHDWSIEGPFSEDNPTTGRGGYLPSGIGWYRKQFALPEDYRDKKVFIEFEGVHMNCDVWINGRHLGHYPYGYTTFYYDMTPHLNFGDKENVIAVRVDNSKQPASRWYTGCGIYRHVWLIISDKLHVSHWGTCVTTPQIPEDTANIHVKTNVTNEYDKTQTCTLVTEIIDGENRSVAKIVSSQKIEKGEEAEFVQEVKVKYPHLWSCENPYLYIARSIVKTGENVLDTYETSFGIREIQYDANKGFLLNGKQVKMKGACLHHDLGCLGSACFDRAKERQLERLMEMGCNAIRTSHNPPAPALLDFCDRNGLLVMDEAFDEWTIGKAPAIRSNSGQPERIPIHAYANYFDEWWEKDLKAMIRRDRNHPSVIMWSVGNEIPEQGRPEKLDVLRKLIDCVHKEDPTRPATSACNKIVAANKSGFADLLDVAGYNYKETFYEEDHKHYPQRIIIGSETRSAAAFIPRGTCDLEALREYDDIREMAFSREIQGPFNKTSYKRFLEAEYSMKMHMQNDYAAGLFIWTGWDYIGEPTPHFWPSRSSYFGAIDLCGFPKDAFFFYQSQWTTDPMIHIFPHWNWEGKEGEIIPVLCYTNCDSADLFLNGKSLGEKDFSSTSALHLHWNVPYEPGTLKVEGKKNGKVVCSKEVLTAGAPAKIELAPDRNKIAADGQDFSFVTARILDKNGNLVPIANNDVTFEVQGEGHLVGVDNGDPTHHHDFKGNHIPALSGLCLAVVQSLTTPGTITLTASSPGLKKQEVKIEALE